jgi:hypothetical protein
VDRIVSNVKLYYADLAVGTIRDPFHSDDTWYGHFDLDLSTQNEELARQTAEYIRFVGGWNERVRYNERADPDEFDQYFNLVKSGLWSTRDEKGNVMHITGAPVFFYGGEVSWRID